MFMSPPPPRWAHPSQFPRFRPPAGSARRPMTSKVIGGRPVAEDIGGARGPARGGEERHGEGGGGPPAGPPHGGGGGGSAQRHTAQLPSARAAALYRQLGSHRGDLHPVAPTRPVACRRRRDPPPARRAALISRRPSPVARA